MIDLTTKERYPVAWRPRYGPSGLHLFERVSGLNILLDEISIPRSLWSLAPRQVSIALTNTCDLACPHCYAPKFHAELAFAHVTSWMAELDSHGCLGVGFGRGEPTLYAQFVNLCQFAAKETRLAITFTTHGHNINARMAERLNGSVHFIRVSMDGIGETYETIRRRSFAILQHQLDLIRTIARFGINFVVNEQTLPDLDAAAAIAQDHGATELLLLPQIAVRRSPAADSSIIRRLQDWADRYDGSLGLTINQQHADGFPTCDPLPKEEGLREYAHVDASGTLKATSFQGTGVKIGKEGIMDAIDMLSGEIEERNE